MAFSDESRRERLPWKVQQANQDKITNAVQELIESFGPVLTCKICMNFFQNAGILPCGHMCCLECFQKRAKRCFECGEVSTEIIKAPEIDDIINSLHLTTNKFIQELAKREPGFNESKTLHHLLQIDKEKPEDVRTTLRRYRQGTYTFGYWKDVLLPGMDWVVLGICGLIGIGTYLRAVEDGWSTRELVTPTLIYICLILATYWIILSGFNRRRLFTMKKKNKDS